MVDTWYDIEPYEEDTENIIREYDITSTPNDFNITTLFNLMDNGVIRIPPFQRNYVWDEKRASKLIESIILGLPIPQVFLYEQGKDNFLIIDGQQRLLSIYFFVKQRFPTDEGRRKLRELLLGKDVINPAVLSDDKYFKNFSLKLPSHVQAEENKYHTLKYETLGDAKRTFEFLRTIRSVVIKQNEPDDDSSMYEVFNRLNTGGQNLKPQEIRMSMYFSDFYTVLFEINALSKWRELIRQKETDINFKDIEILVRSFAMLFWHEQYKAPMTKFLNSFSKTGKSFESSMNKYLRLLFDSFLTSCQNLSAKDFFSANNKFNISLFESVFVAACLPYFKNQQIINGKIVEQSVQCLKNDDEFVKATQSSIASKASVATRMQRAKELIALN
jgi:uncharacterized protein with ParB-like and HNH nuclease domain